MSEKAEGIEDLPVVQEIIRSNIPQESVEQLINLIRLRRTNELREQKIEELKKLTDGQNQVQFANNLRRILTLASKDDGSFEMNAELEKLLEKALSGDDDSLIDILHGIGLRFDVDFDQENFDNLVKDIDSSNDAELKELLKEFSELPSGQKPSDDQLKKLATLVNDEENVELRKLVNKNKLLQSQKKYSKAERENMIESIRLFVDQKHSLNDMAIQTLIRLESEMDQTYQYLMSIVKSFSDTLRTVARNVKGG